MGSNNSSAKSNDNMVNSFNSNQIDHNQSKTRKIGYIFGLSSFQMLAMFRRGLFYTFLSIYMRDYLKMSVTATTLWETIPMFMSGIFQVFVWGRLSDKLQRRRTFIVLGEILAGIGLLITYFIHTSTSDLTKAGYVIIIGLSIIEIFWSMSNISWSALISDLYPSKKRSQIMGQLTSLGGIGRIFGVLLGSFLYDGMGKQYPGWGFREGWIFIFASIIMFISTIPMLFVPEGGTKMNNIRVTSVDTSTTPLATTSVLPFSSSSVLENMVENQKKSLKSQMPYLNFFVLFILSLFLMNFGRNSIDVMYTQFLVLSDGFNLTSDIVGYIVNVRSVATISIGILVGTFSKKWGHGNTLLGGIIIGLLALIATAFSNSLAILFIASFLFGMGEVIIAAASYAYAALLIPEEVRGKLFGIYNAAFFLSWGIPSTFVTGPIIDNLIALGNPVHYSYQIAFIVAILITSLGFLMILSLEFYRRKNQIGNE